MTKAIIDSLNKLTFGQLKPLSVEDLITFRTILEKSTTLVQDVINWKIQERRQKENSPPGNKTTK